MKKIQKKFKLLIKLSIVIILLPLAFFIRAISFFCLLRFDKIVTSRIGHFCSYFEIYLCEKEYKKNMPLVPYFDFFYSSKFICNNYLYKLAKRKINIIHIN